MGSESYCLVMGEKSKVYVFTGIKQNLVLFWSFGGFYFGTCEKLDLTVNQSIQVNWVSEVK